MSEALASEGFAEIGHRRAVLTTRAVRTSEAYTPRLDWRSGVAMIVGGLLTGWVAVITPFGLDNGQSIDVQQVAFDDLDRASQSLVASDAAGLIESARTCSKPLAFLTINPTGPNGWIRFRSGTYTSPKLSLNRPGRVAMPFPAPYAIGHGEITVENQSGGTEIFLKPAVVLGAGPETKVIQVHWDPKATCR